MKQHVLAMALAILATAAAAQTSVSVGSLEHDTDLPVEVTSDTLSVANEDGQAIFQGNVVVIQGPMRLASAKLEVSYTGTNNDIQEMVATGGVTFVNGTEAAESDRAVYDPDAGTLVMLGDVLLTQGATAIAGDRLTVNLEDGTGRMEGQVSTTFQTGGD